jgi:hypothetical protein
MIWVVWILVVIFIVYCVIIKTYMYILYVIQLSDRIYNVTFPEYISQAGNVTWYTLSDSW